MKHYIISLVVLLLSCLISTSCTDEDVVDGKSKYETGIPVSLSLSFKPDVPDVVTRAGESMDEYKDDVYDITIFAFAEDGSVNKIETYHGEDNAMLGKKTGFVDNFETLSGINYIYAVANAETNYYTGLIDKLKKCKKRSDFLDAVATLQQLSIDLIDGRFLMSGVFVPDGEQEPGSGMVDISSAMTELTGVIQLTRVASSITFNIEKGGDCTEFIPKSWKVVAVPASTYLFGKNTDYDGSEQTFFDSDLALFNQNQTSITFYMTENRKTSKEVSSFKDRQEKRPTNATYLQLTGVYSGKADKYDGEKVTTGNVAAEAFVTYYIPLGNTSSPENLGNYETKRNTQYTYNVTVNGVRDIIVEVIEGVETSVAGGDVIYKSADGASYKLLDAHYEARLLTFKLSDITRKESLIYGVKTPYTNGYEYDNDATDINWVKFLIHKDASGAKTMKDYPGDKSRDLLTVKELMDLMIKAKGAGDEQTLFNVSQGDDKLLYVTAFIDEYYYDNKNWRTFVNSPNREMLLLCSTQSGFDSSVTDATFVLSQRSIQTYYTLDENAGNIVAVGLEWANETPVRNGIPNGGGQHFLSPNGRSNMLQDLSLSNWRTVPTLTENYLVSNTDDEDHFHYHGNLDPFTACMSRNRNSSGSNEINPDDVKWFLPSIEQYQYIVLGQSGYDQGAYLYPSGRRKSDRLHFFANSKTSTGRNILWAEEGMSTSTDTEYNDPSFLNSRHSIRCIRYLGNVEGPEKTLVERKEIIINGSNYNVLKMSYLNSNSIRKSSTSGALANHDELQENNKPYTAFAVYNKNISNSMNCPKGWRKPNQREMSLMLTLLGIGTEGKYLTSTIFSEKNGMEFILSSGGMGLGNDKRNGIIRCVRDVEIN